MVIPQPKFNTYLYIFILLINTLEIDDLMK